MIIIIFVVIIVTIIIIININIFIEKGCQCKAGRERLTPYQSEDPAPQYQLTHRMKEERRKTSGNKRGASSDKLSFAESEPKSYRKPMKDRQ